MLIGSKHAVKNTRPLQIVLDGKSMKQSDYFKYLGIYIDHCLTWNKHVNYIQSRVYPKLNLLNRISSFLSRDILLRIYKQTVLPLLDYGCVIWGECSKENAQCLERLQNRAMRIILLIIWLAPWAGKMNQIARCDWLPERARWSHLARSGLPAVSRKQNFTKSHIINPLLTKFVRSRLLDIGLVHFLRVYGPRLRLGP